MPVGYAVEALGTSAYFTAGYAVANRNVRVMPWLMLFLVSVCLILFNKAAAVGLVASDIGTLASFLVVFHGIVFWCVWRSYSALRQARVNDAIVRRMEFDAELKRRLSESDEPPPPAATFDTRFGSMTPGDPQPRLGAN